MMFASLFLSRLVAHATNRHVPLTSQTRRHWPLPRQNPNLPSNGVRRHNSFEFQLLVIYQRGNRLPEAFPKFTKLLRKLALRLRQVWFNHESGPVASLVLFPVVKLFFWKFFKALFVDFLTRIGDPTPGVSWPVLKMMGWRLDSGEDGRTSFGQRVFSVR